MTLLMFNLFRKMHFKNGVINFLASLTLLAYLLHENIIFRNYTRPLIWEAIYTSIGFNNVALISFVYSLALFVAVFGIGIIYKLFVQKWICRFSEKISDGLYEKTNIQY